HLFPISSSWFPAFSTSPSIAGTGKRECYACPGKTVSVGYVCVPVGIDLSVRAGISAEGGFTAHASSLAFHRGCCTALADGHSKRLLWVDVNNPEPNLSALPGLAWVAISSGYPAAWKVSRAAYIAIRTVPAALTSLADYNP